MTERQLQDAIIQLAELLGWRVYHVGNVQGQLRSGTSMGFPDLVLAHYMHGVMFRELKTQRGRLSPEQALWGAVLREDCEVWRPAEWHDGTIERQLRGGR